MRIDASTSARRAGFSLLELILILAVVTTLLAVGSQALFSLLQASAVTSAADLIQHALDDAHAQAVTHNTPIEMRLYALVPPAGGAPIYSALQAHWRNGDGTTPPSARLVALSSWVALDATPAHSPLIASNGLSATPDPTDRLLNAQTRAFHFLPDGSTDLDSGTQWFVTVRSASQSDPSHFPANWACVAVDGSTGRTQIFRP